MVLLSGFTGSAVGVVLFLGVISLAIISALIAGVINMIVKTTTRLEWQFWQIFLVVLALLIVAVGAISYVGSLKYS